MNPIPRTIYLNIAAIGEPTERVWNLIGAYERLTSALGRKSERSRELMMGHYLRTATGSPDDWEVIEREWRGLPGLASALRKCFQLSDKISNVLLVPGTSSAIGCVLGAVSEDVPTLVTTDLEHASEYRAIYSRWSGTHRVIKLRDLLMRGGNADDIAEVISEGLVEHSALLISHVATDHGSVIPIELICSLVKDNYQDVTTIIDGAHGLGNLNVDLSTTRFDYYVGSGHKWLRGPATSGFILTGECSRQRHRVGLERHLVRSHSWFGAELDLPERVEFLDELGFSPPVGTQCMYLFVGLMACLNELIEETPRIRQRRILEKRVEFEDLVRSRLQCRIVNDEISLSASGISSLVPPAANEEHIRTIARALEYEHGVIAEGDSGEHLRFSFRGSETSENIEYVVDALKSIMEQKE